MDAELNPAQRLHMLGQSLWLDSINRVMLRTGALARYVRDLAVTGLTSNPTILGHAMAAGPDYDRSLARLAGEGVTDAQDLVYALALEDLAEAAALFRPAWEQTEGAAATCHWRSRPTSPTTPRRRWRSPGDCTTRAASQPAGQDPRHAAGPDRHGRGDHRRHRRERNAAVLRHPLPAHRRRVPASPRAPPPRRPGPGGALGGLAVHLPLGFRRRPRAAVRAARHPGAGDGAKDLRLPCAAARGPALAGARRAGARPQRVLWASTSTKNPDLPDTYYLGRLAAPNTINTVPEKTLLAFADHGSLDDRLQPDYAAAERAISAAANAGIDADALAEHLQRQGAGAFTADWAALLEAIKAKAANPTT